ncbi:MAG: DUF1330 domain-containing protein [Balneola sp.]
MPYEILVGLNVTDDELYQKYRDEMTPILKNYGGGFRYDFLIEKVLKTDSESKINRVFAIYFESEEAKNEFFLNDKYLQIKQKYFTPSVSETTIIAEYIK